MAMQESGEMYLETIYVLSRQSSSVRSIDVADRKPVFRGNMPAVRLNCRKMFYPVSRWPLR